MVHAAGPARGCRRTPTASWCGRSHSVRGANGASFSAGSGSRCSAIQSAEAEPVACSARRCRLRSRSSRPGCSARGAASSASTCSSDGAPWRSCFRLRSTDSSRSSASSSWTSMSVSRMMRNRCAPIDLDVRETARCRFRRMTSSRNANVRPRRRPMRRTGTKRGSTSGILTRANFVRPAVPDDDREVLAAVRDERKRMAGIERQRRQQREDLASEVRRQVAAGSRRCSRRARGTGRRARRAPAAARRCQHAAWSLHHRAPRARGWPRAAATIVRPSGDTCSRPARWLLAAASPRAP